MQGTNNTSPSPSVSPLPSTWDTTVNLGKRLAGIAISETLSSAVVVAITNSSLQTLGAFKATRERIPSPFYSSASDFLKVVAAADFVGNLAVNLLTRSFDISNSLAHQSIRFLGSGLMAAGMNKFFFKEALQLKKVCFVATLVVLARFALDTIESYRNSARIEENEKLKQQRSELNQSVQRLKIDKNHLENIEQRFVTLSEGGSVFLGTGENRVRIHATSTHAPESLDKKDDSSSVSLDIVTGLPPVVV